MNYYKPLKVESTDVAGIIESLKAMRLPKGSENDTNFPKAHFGWTDDIIGPSDARLAKSLILAGADHAKFQRGIIAWMTLHLQAGFMIEFETYRHGVEVLSTTSSMHNELKVYQGESLANKKQKDLSEKVYVRSLHMSYQALRSIYKARRNHAHPDWQIFCDFIETLPYFNILIFPEGGK